MPALVAPDIRKAVHDAVTANRPRIIDLLSEMVACDSFTHDKAGVDRVGEMVAREMPAGFTHERVVNPNGGDHHLFRRFRPGVKPVVLAGHLDTISSREKGFDHLSAAGNTLTGPGVNDMKGGDVVILWALKTLDSLGLAERLPILCIFNGDEEQGSPDSNRLFTALRGKASAAFVYECGGPSDTVVVQRKGIARYRMRISGTACHFGNLKGPKSSAVEEMARKVLAIEAMNRADGRLVANAGRAEGGLLANCVADRAEIDFEFRYHEDAMAGEVERAVRELAGHVETPGCACEVSQLSRRPAMVPTDGSRHLLTIIQNVAREMGRSIGEETRGGGSDAGWLSQAGIPTLDGLGPLGDKDHSPGEYILTESLYDRIELTAHLLLVLSAQEHPPEHLVQ